MKERYFKSTQQMVEYAEKDIDFWGVFEFQYDITGNKLHGLVEDIKSIKIVDDNTFKFENCVYSLDLVIPC